MATPLLCLPILIGDERVDPTIQDQRALVTAARSGNAGVVKALLNHKGVDPNAQNNTPLLEAIANARSGVIDVLLDDDRVEPEKYTRDVQAALRKALKMGYKEFVDDFVESVGIPFVAEEPQKPGDSKLPGHLFIGAQKDESKSEEEESSAEEARELRIHILQHNSFCDSGTFYNWAIDRGYKITTTLFENKDWTLPAHDQYEWLVIIGGTMSVNDEAEFDFIAKEKAWVTEAIKLDKVILGICFGAQLIATCLGAKVHRAECGLTVGWVKMMPQAKSPLLQIPDDGFDFIEWHEDTFDLPPGATLLASSQHCKHEAYSANNERIFASQFHPEMSLAGCQILCDRDDLVAKQKEFPLVTSQEQVLNATKYKQQQEIFIKTLEQLEQTLVFS